MGVGRYSLVSEEMQSESENRQQVLLTCNTDKQVDSLQTRTHAATQTPSTGLRHPSSTTPITDYAIVLEKLVTVS